MPQTPATGTVTVYGKTARQAVLAAQQKYYNPFQIPNGPAANYNPGVTGVTGPNTGWTGPTGSTGPTGYAYYSGQVVFVGNADIELAPGTDVVPAALANSKDN